MTFAERIAALEQRLAAAEARRLRRLQLHRASNGLLMTSSGVSTPGHLEQAKDLPRPASDRRADTCTPLAQQEAPSLQLTEHLERLRKSLLVQQAAQTLPEGWHWRYESEAEMDGNCWVMTMTAIPEPMWAVHE